MATFTDPLERDALVAQIERAYRARIPLALLLIDVEPTTSIVTYEDAVALRSAIRRRLADMVRRPDLAVAVDGRYAVIAAGIDQPWLAEAIAERLLAALSVAIDLEGRAITITAGIGVATTAMAAEAADLLRCAEESIVFPPLGRAA